MRMEKSGESSANFAFSVMLLRARSSSVVPPWMFGKVIDRPQVINKQGPRLRGGSSDAVQIHLLATVICPQCDQIVLVRLDAKLHDHYP
jgi:hypothetical protein